MAGGFLSYSPDTLLLTTSIRDMFIYCAQKERVIEIKADIPGVNKNEIKCVAPLFVALIDVKLCARIQ